MDTLKHMIETNESLEQIAVGSAVGASSVLSAGYVMWMLRGGYLVSSMLAQMPAWRMVDPLVVLQYLEEEYEENDDDEEDEKNGDESVERMFAEAHA